MFVEDPLREPSVITPDPAGKSQRSLLAGAEKAVCDILQIARLGHRSALHELGSRQSIAAGSVAAAFYCISGNWERARQAGLGSPSRQNWRWCNPQLGIAEQNRSPEVVLERAIVRAFQKSHPGRWANQVPVASGVAGAHAERRRAIDLIERVDENAFRFIELKVASDTPLYAAYEILFYLLIWLLARQEGSSHSPLLAARRIEASVLAPASYYRGYQLEALQSQLAKEVTALGQRFDLALGIAFERFPAGFMIRPVYSDDALINVIGRRERL